MRTRGPYELALLPERGERPGATPPPGAAPELTFQAVDEPNPGERWRAAFAAMWPSYRAWYLKEGASARPDLRTCRRMLERWMPELIPIFERLVALAGDDPLAARFLSMYRPPGFVVGCTQAAFTGDGGPVLVRNYDYPASRIEGVVYSTAWTGRRVIGMSDCLCGLVDGINEAGLAVSLTFGGRPVVGDAFLDPPLYRTTVQNGTGTLYTAAYYPVLGRAEYRWPGHVSAQSFERFVEETHTQRYPRDVSCAE